MLYVILTLRSLTQRTLSLLLYRDYLILIYQDSVPSWCIKVKSLSASQQLITLEEQKVIIL